MSAHCSWCADAYRSVLLGLVAKGVRACVIARHYGIRPTTVVETTAEGRRRGCLAPPRCLYCPALVTRVGGCCDSVKCGRLYSRDYMRARRASGIIGKGLGRREYPEPEGMEWPVLPPNPRERSLRNPPEVLVKPSGMLVMAAPVLSPSPQGFVRVGRARTAPIGALPHARMAA